MCSRTGKEAAVSFLKNRFVSLVEKWRTWSYFLFCTILGSASGAAEVKFYNIFK